MIDRRQMVKNTLGNLIQTIALLLVMTVVGGLAVYLALGADGLFIAIVAAVVFLLGSSRISTARLLRARGARPLPYGSFPDLHRINVHLAQKAGLEKPPELYWEPSRLMNGYAAGDEEQPVIVLTDQLLSRLDTRALAAILGHEMAHIRNKDLRVMAIAAFVQHMTSALSTVFQVMLVIMLPFWVTGTLEIAMLPVMFIIFAPSIAMLLQLALSRTREFDADLVGVQLTGDPLGLILALQRLQQYHQRFFFRFLPGMWRSDVSWLQTHPPTSQRIARLAGIAQRPTLTTMGRTGNGVCSSLHPGRCIC